MISSLVMSALRGAAPITAQPRTAAPRQAAGDFGADTLAGEDLEQHGVAQPAVDDVRLLDAVVERLEAALDLGDHALGDDAAGDELARALVVEGRHHAAGLVMDAVDVGQQDELLGAQRFGDLAGDQVGVDVEGLAAVADADWRDDRDDGAAIERLEDHGIDRRDLADHADVELLAGGGGVGGGHAQLAGADQLAVLAGQADRVAAVMVDQADDLLVRLAHQHHLDDL